MRFNDEQNHEDSAEEIHKRDDKILDEITNKSERSSFGAKFTVEDYWTSVKGFNPEDLNEGKKGALSESFNRLVRSGKLKVIRDGFYALADSQESNSSPQEQASKPTSYRSTGHSTTGEQLQAEVAPKVNNGHDDSETFIPNEDVTESDQTPKPILEPEPAPESASKQTPELPPEPNEDKKGGEMPAMGNIINTGDYIPDEKGERDKHEMPRLVVNNAENPDESRRTGSEIVEQQQANVSVEEDIPEWKKSKEWSELEELRIRYAEAERDYRKAILFSTKKGVMLNPLELKSFSREKNFERVNELETKRRNAKSVYEKQRNIIAQKIKESLTVETGENLTPDQETEFKSKINSILFEELIRKENNSYLGALKEARRETLVGKALENAKNVLSTKTMQWYLGLSRKQRMALNFGVGSITGLAFGATVAPGMVGLAGYLGWRAARVGLSGTAGMKAGEWANKKWSIEELKTAEEKEVEELKNSDLSLEEKYKGYEDIRRRYKKESVKATLKKAGTTIAAGAGTGFITGLIEQGIIGMGGTTRSVIESKKGKIVDIQENKLPPRKGYEPEIKPKTQTPVPEDVKTSGPEAPESESIKPKMQEEAAKAEITQEEVQKVTETAAIEPEKTTVPAEEIFSDPSVLRHEVVAGDSTWKILKNILENNDKFKGMTEAQKTYVLSSFTNKALENPESYGIGRGGITHVGDKADFSKLFEPKETNSLLDEAINKVKPDSSLEKSILSNNEKIENWVRTHPNTVLNEERVSEILSIKPKVGAESSITNEIMEKIDKKIEPVPSRLPDTLETSPNVAEAASVIPEPPKISQEADTSGMKILDAEKQTRIVQEIEEAKRRLTELEKGGRNPNLERTLASDSRSFISNTDFNEDIEEAFRAEVDDVYGKKGILGVGRTEGVNTEEWAEMAKLPANKVVEYYTGDSSRSGLSSDIIERLSKSEEHNAFMRQAAGLMNQSKGAVKPFEKETMEQFIKRLGGYVLKTHLQELKKEA